MATDNADDLVMFQDVRVIGSTGAALHCRIGQKCLWLPRAHISGRLWCTGDRGKLFIRRWVAQDRHLLDGPGTTAALPIPALPHPFGRLHLVRSDRKARHGE